MTAISKRQVSRFSFDRCDIVGQEDELTASRTLMRVVETPSGRLSPVAKNETKSMMRRIPIVKGSGNVLRQVVDLPYRLSLLIVPIATSTHMYHVGPRAAAMRTLNGGQR